MFQSARPICIVVMGGLHKTALATHLLGNWKIHNKPPSIINVVPLTPIQINSPLLYDIDVHVITPTKMKILQNYKIFQMSTYENYKK
jgi:hypothetical protein